MTIAEGELLLADDILAIELTAQMALDLAGAALPMAGGTVAALTVGLAGKNALSMTPGAKATNPIVLSQSGTGGFQIGSASTASLTIAPAATPGGGATINTDNGKGSLSFIAEAVFLGYPFTNYLAITLGDGSVPIRIDTASPEVGIEFSDRIAIGNPTAVNNILTIAPGAAATSPIALSQSGTGGLTLPALAGSLVMGTGPQNKLTILPGAAAANPITLSQSGTGGFQIGSASTASLKITHAATPGGGATISTDNAKGSLSVVAESVFLGYPLTNYVAITLGDGSVPIRIDTASPAVGIEFSDRIAIGNSTAANNILTIAPGAAAASPIALSQSGTGGLTLPALAGSLVTGTGSQNKLTILPGAAAANPITLSQSGTGGFQIGSPSTASLTIEHAATPGGGVTINTDNGKGSLSFIAEAVFLGYPLTNYVAITLGDGSVPIRIDTASPAVGIEFSDRIAIGNSTAANNILTIAPGAAAASPIALSQSGSGGLTLPALAGSLVMGTGPQNKLTILPGAAAANPITLSQSGTGGFQIGSASTASLKITHAATPGGGATISTDNGKGSLSVVAESVFLGYPLTNYVAITLGDGSVPIRIDTASPEVGIEFSDRIAIGNSTAANNILTIAPGAAATSPIALSQSGSGGLTLPALAGSLVMGTGPQNKLTILPGAAAANPITLSQSGTGGFQIGSPSTASLKITHAATPGGGATISTDNGKGSLSVVAESVFLGYPLTNYVAITLGDGSVPIRIDTASSAYGIQFSDRLAIGNSTAVNNILTIAPGAAATSPIALSQSGSGGLTLPPLTGAVIGTSGQNTLTITPGAAAAATMITLGGTGPLQLGTGSQTGLSITPGANTFLNAIVSPTGGFANIQFVGGQNVGFSRALVGSQILLIGGAAANDVVTVSYTGTGGMQFSSKLGFNAVTPILKPTGYSTPTGTATRATFATSTVTLAQLAEHVKALIDDFTSYGLIGP